MDSKPLSLATTSILGQPPSAFPPAIFLMGPTASGKSTLAINLAGSLGCEIISVDSAMVYCGMDIGTAKPTTEEMAEVPHHLIDILDPAKPYSTGVFRQQALSLMHSITKRGKIPLLVGGTMLYFKSLLSGLSELPTANFEIRKQIEKEARQSGWADLHQHLSRIDPVAATRIHPNDPQRIQRAIEVYRITGETLTDLCVKGVTGAIPFRKITLIVAPVDRARLHHTIEIRFFSMIEKGLIDEVRLLFNRSDLSDNLPSIRAVGYKQVWMYLDGKYSKKEMIARAVIATRQLSKRQFTWLRKEKPTLNYFSNENNKLSRRVSADIQRIIDN